jgi:hypothetical protein
MPVRWDWSRGCGAKDTEYISGQAGPPARTCACIEVPEEEKEVGQQARMASREAQLAAAMSLARAEMPKQPQECSQRTPQPQQLRDQPKGHSVRQQQELEEPSPPNTDWPRSQGEEDAMHNSRRAEPQDETAAEVRPTPPTNAVRGCRRTGQAAEVAEALIPSPTNEDPPTARNGRPTASGMSTGATAATADEDGPVAPLSGKPAPMEAEAQVPHPADLLALQVPRKWILEAAAATSRDQAQGTAGSVAQCELQAGDEELPKRGSPVEVQQTLHQEETGREAGAENFPERGTLWSLKIGAGGEMRRLIIVVAVEEVCRRRGGNHKETQESCGNGDKRPAGIAAPREEWEDFVGAVEDKGDEDDPHHATLNQAGYPVPGHQRWEPGKWQLGLREDKGLRP